MDDSKSKKLTLTGPDAIQLEKKGYVVIDDFLGLEWSTSLRSELKNLVDSDQLLPNQVQFGSPSGPVRFTKPHIYEADLHNITLRQQCPEFSSLYYSDNICEAINTALPNFGLAPGVTGKVGDGGELQLVPFLERPVTIDPIMDRAVLFRSDVLLHRVLPTHKPRFCFTVWLDAIVGAVNRNSDIQLKAKHLTLSPTNLSALFNSPLQRILSRAVYADEYEASIQECMQGSDGAQYMTQYHRKHIEMLKTNTSLALCIERLRDMKYKDQK
eukprot:GSMAST32.ASY1.ANO1.185.1 assembled CDS